MPALRSKILSLAAAGALVLDGCRLALGRFAVYQHPMAPAASRPHRGRLGERQRRGPAGRLGCLRRVESSYVGLEKYWLPPNFRRRVERGELEMVDYPELLSFDRFRANQDRLTFWPCDYLGGTDS
jgi:glutaconate CoA-transferase, subunit A